MMADLTIQNTPAQYVFSILNSFFLFTNRFAFATFTEKEDCK